MDGGGSSVDGAVDMELRGLGDGRRLVVEVDGPSHFMNWGENGSTGLKRRVLVGMGWEVTSVPFFE